MNDYVIGIDLAHGPDCSVMSDGTVVTNPCWEEKEVSNRRRQNSAIEKLKYMIENQQIKFCTNNNLLEEMLEFNLKKGVNRI